MQFKYLYRSALLSALVFAIPLIPLQSANAQAVDAEGQPLEEIVVTGSRIRRDPLNEAAAIMDIDTAELDRSGLTSLADALQDLPITGSSINSQFNVPGNSGFPQDGSGIGAGAAQISLRNVDAKRTLILVDGKRWIAGASASGVPSAVDLNTIPDNMIKRVEILQDGASAIYGSDAIGGVVNIITNSDFEGFKIDAQTGSYITDSDGESSEVSALFGGGNDQTHLVFSASYVKERGIDTFDRPRSAFPTPDATSCLAGGCSSFTPQARLIFGPNFAGGADVTLNDGVLNDGGANIPVFDPLNPTAGDFHAFSAADRFNFNGPGFNYLKTPNERVNLYAGVTHEISDILRVVAKASYTNRQSATKGAPEPLCFGPGCGSRITDNFSISALNPFNPFGVDLSPELGTLEFFARRPLESGRRLFFQDVNTYFVSVGLEGEFGAGGRNFYWDVTSSYGDNRGFQEKFNSHNAAKLQIAMGDPAICATVPNCVPFNFFGGQGPNGTGSITQEMLDFVGFTQRDFSEQTLKDFSANITGDILSLPAGNLAFAAGFEFRDHEGSFRPDDIAARGETAGIPSGPTTGDFDVTEFYGELNIPILSGDQYLELNLAARASDYSTSGSEGTYKASVLFRPVDEFSVRGSFSTGLRAPGIGELFGGAAREDFTFLDPCADVLGTLGAAAGGRDAPQPQNIIDNCATLGVPVGLAQTNPQLSALSTGNSTLIAETSDAFTFGLVWSPSFVDNVGWIEGLSASVDYYDLEIEDAVQGLTPGNLIDSCVQTLDPFFCDQTPRTNSGQLSTVQNQLQNLGGIDASGFDVVVDFAGPETGIGQFTARFNATFLSDYTERTRNADGSETAIDLTGTHPDETFFRAFPELRWTTNIGWNYDRWHADLGFRWVDEMLLDSGSTLDSAIFTDLQVRYTAPFADDGLTFTLGFKNILDEDPPVCDACGIIGLSPVSHDLPGTVGYFRVTYQQ